MSTQNITKCFRYDEALEAINRLIIPGYKSPDDDPDFIAYEWYGANMDDAFEGGKKVGEQETLQYIKAILEGQA